MGSFLEIFIWTDLNSLKEYYNGLSYVSNADLHTTFEQACRCGQVEKAKWIYSLVKINHNIYDESYFREACYGNHLEMAKWLWSLGGINHHCRRDTVFWQSYSNHYIEMLNGFGH